MMADHLTSEQAELYLTAISTDASAEARIKAAGDLLARPLPYDADKEHRKTINNAIVAELIECSGISAEQAQKIVVHMVSGLVPNVTLKY